uniref:Rad51 domain-containing protein n=1 Tax=Steinernema glaseri TaxID=37863 RepID=A0A1I7XYJ5_9BILA
MFLVHYARNFDQTALTFFGTRLPTFYSNRPTGTVLIVTVSSNVMRKKHQEGLGVESAPIYRIPDRITHELFEPCSDQYQHTVPPGSFPGG